MTEAEWLGCDSPDRILNPLRRAADDRKLRLFAVACCRKIWPIYRGKRSCRGVVLAERLADGLRIEEHLPDFRSALHDEGFREIDGYRQEKANNVQWHLAIAAYHALADGVAVAAERPSAVELLAGLRDGDFAGLLAQFRRTAPGERSPFSIEAWIPPDATQTWRHAAWAVGRTYGGVGSWTWY